MHSFSHIFCVVLVFLLQPRNSVEIGWRDQEDLKPRCQTGGTHGLMCLILGDWLYKIAF